MVDHLPQPHDSLGFPDFPIFGTPGFDHGNWIKYPERHGWNAALVLKHDFSAGSHQRSVLDIAEFVQNWLFFGFLEVSLQLPIDEKTFTRRAADGRLLLCTKALPELLWQWSERAARFDRQGKLREFQEVEEVFSIVQPMVQTLSRNLHPLKNELPLTLVQSIAILGATLDFAISSVVRPPARSDVYSDELAFLGGSGQWGWSALHEIFAKRGWCQNDQLRLSKNCFTTGAVYASFLRRSERVSHATCSEWRCVANDISDDVRYDQRHSQNCPQLAPSCGQSGPDMAAVIDCLSNDRIPLIRLEQLPSGRLRPVVVPLEPGMPYVAISHVWSDGLGNPSANTLPDCMLAWISATLQGLPSAAAENMQPSSGRSSNLKQCSTTRQEAVCPLFWLDTICVPVREDQREFRILAIKLMAETYRRASQVMVLDSELQQFKLQDMAPEETLMRVSVSAWMRRVWTLQEAVFAQRLHVLFADGLLDLDHMMRRLRHELNIDVPSSLCSIPYESTMFYAGLRTLTLSLGMKRFIQAWIAIQTRQTSVAEDELTCFANILGVDPSTILAIPRYDAVSAQHARVHQSQRMKALFSLFDEIPQGIIWAKLQRLQSFVGFRWAPSSLVGGNIHGMSHKPAKRDAAGLHVTAPGILLEGPWIDPDFGAVCAYEDSDSGESFRLVPNGWFHRTEFLDRDGILNPSRVPVEYSSDTRLALIVETIRRDLHHQPSAALVCIESAPGDPEIRCRYERVVRLASDTQSSFELSGVIPEGVIMPPQAHVEGKRTARWLDEGQQWVIA